MATPLEDNSKKKHHTRSSSIKLAPPLSEPERVYRRRLGNRSIQVSHGSSTENVEALEYISCLFLKIQANKFLKGSWHQGNANCTKPGTKYFKETPMLCIINIISSFLNSKVTVD